MIERIASNVRARAPLRLGLAGGGTDLAVYCDQFGGAVLNATIDRFAYAHIKQRDDGQLHFTAHDIGQCETHGATVELDVRSGLVLHRAVYRHIMTTFNDGEPLPLSVSTTIDVPAGSGLGASSALVVALIEAFAVAMDLPLGPYDVARLAFEIEREHIGLAGGKQDQYAAAFGGFNFIEFLPGGRDVIVNPLRLRRDYLFEFESSLVICFTGQSRESADIIKQQVGGLQQFDAVALESMHAIKDSAVEMKRLLLAGDIRGTAEILHRSWTSKKKTATGVTNSQVDRLLDVALDAGAWAGKVSGAGGGGFLMLLIDPEQRHGLINVLDAAGGQASAVKLTFEGTQAWQSRL
jgi:D-glycero-alpha-D-manno-heptose-7-phosphate kinase